MTVSATNALSGPLFGNGATTVFPFNFRAQNINEVSVLVNGVQQVAGVSASLTLDASGNLIGGGSVTFVTPPANGATILIVSDPSFTQETAFEDAGQFLPSTHDDALDRAAIRDIALQGQIDRAPLVPVGETLANLPAAAARAGKFFGFDAQGNPVALSGTGGDAVLRSDLATSGGSALSGFLQAGTGAIGRTVQSKLREFVSILDFGAVADCTAIGGGTDNTAAFQAAINAAPLGGSIYIPAGKYRIAGTLTFTHMVRLFGEGWSQNPGTVGGTSYSAPNYFNGTILVFDTGVAGFKFVAYTDNNADSTAFEFQSSYGSMIRDMMLYGGGGTGTTAHGIETRTTINLDNVAIWNFAGTGLKFVAYASGANPYGSSDIGSYRRVSCRYNRLHGVHVIGDDANVNHFDVCDAGWNGGVGYLFPIGGLGNKLTCCHATTNNQSHPSNVNAALHSAGQRTQNTTDWSGLSDANAGSFVSLGGVINDVFDGCYSEVGQGAKAKILPPALVFGGLLATSTNHTADSTAPRFNSAQILNINQIVADNTAILTVDADTHRFKNLADSQTFLIVNASGMTVPEVAAASVSAPAAGFQTLFIDTADHKLKRKDSGGTVTIIA